MTRAAEIQCIKSNPRHNLYERILYIGGASSSGWQITQQDAIGKIQRGEWEFYVTVNGRRVSLVVAKSRSGQNYLKTEIDGDEPNNLLGLPECP